MFLRSFRCVGDEVECFIQFSVLQGESSCTMSKFGCCATQLRIVYKGTHLAVEVILEGMK